MMTPALSHASETGFLDRSVTLNGVTYLYQVYVPNAYSKDKSWPIALFLHGSGERGDDGMVQTQVGIGAAIRADRQRFPMIVVMPQARGNTRWTGEMAAQALKALDQGLGDDARLVKNTLNEQFAITGRPVGPRRLVPQSSPRARESRLIRWSVLDEVVPPDSGAGDSFQAVCIAVVP